MNVLFTKIVDDVAIEKAYTVTDLWWVYI